MTVQIKDRHIGNKDEAIKVKDLVLASLDRDKAEDIMVIDLEGKTDFAHYMIIASGRSSRHVSSVAEKIIEDLKRNEYYDIAVEGLKESNWVLIDTLDVIIHIFLPEVRENYSLEKIWGFTLSPSKKTL